MAEVKEPNEPTVPAKRKQFDPLFPDKDELDEPNKTQKIESFASSNSNHRNSPPTEAGNPSANDCGGQDFAPSFSIRGEDAGKADEINGIKVDEEDEEEENGEAAVLDRKGKGIMIEEEEEDSGSDDDDDDDSSDDDEDGSENGGGDDDSELEDDPLAEVDLDNILTSRTRRRGVQPGFYIANDPGMADEDDSDDSDA